MNDLLTEKDIIGVAVPPTWTYCFNEQCPKSGGCLRFLTAQTVPDNITTGRVVFPNAVNEGNCRYYHKARRIKTAWGFGRLFESVKVSDVKSLREDMMTCLKGSTNYYRYHHGEKQLTPEQQERIGRLFAKYGYDSELKFEKYGEAIDFG